MSKSSPVQLVDTPAPEEPADEYDVVLHGVSHSYGRNQVLDDVSLAVHRGSFFGILGPSGSGKTTLLRIIGGFIIPGDGQVYIGNELMGSTPPYRRHTTMVFQHLALFPHMTVMENLAYGLKLHGVPRDKVAAKVGRALEMVHLSGLEARRPRQLSGGEQQRVALARALVLEPRVVLFDEPLGSLDLKLRREMQVELKSIQRRLGTTFLYVTHDQQEAIAMCDRIAVMNKGRIVQAGTAEDIYERPETRFVADFIGDINFLDGQVTGREDSLAVIDAGGLVLRAPDPGTLRPGRRLPSASGQNGWSWARQPLRRPCICLPASSSSLTPERCAAACWSCPMAPGSRPIWTPGPWPNCVWAVKWPLVGPSKTGTSSPVESTIPQNHKEWKEWNGISVYRRCVS